MKSFERVEIRAAGDDRVRCPTCGAEQEWADSCRRCRCDLRLLRAARAAYRVHRRQCLTSIESGWFENARYHALRCHELLPDAASSRLLAICHLMTERWADAVELARAALEEPGASSG